MDFKYSVILICLAFAIFLIVKETKRQDKSRLTLRLLASVLTVACFALLIIPVRYNIKKEEPLSELNFFTEKPNPFIDLNYHLQAHPEIKKINIYGYGLSIDELKKLNAYQLSFHPLAIPSGFISASWLKKIKTTEQLTVQGTYQNSTNNTVKIKLFGLGTSLDSAVVKANTKVNFSFTSNPKQLGKAVFNLIALNGKDTLVVEPVPVEVEGLEPIKVLILASFPDFEYKFLKKWLFENQFQVAFRGQISKDKYSTEFLNRKAVNLNQINQSLLKNFDVAIIDEEEINRELMIAVNNGMGLLVRAKAMKSVQDHQPLLTDTAGKVSVDSRLSGAGKIITTNISSTYQWQLSGKEVDYSQFWSLLLKKALRKKVKPYTYGIEPQWPTIDEKTRLSLSVSSTEPPIVIIDSANVAPRQNMELPFEWDGLFWPKAQGWTTLSINNKVENIFNYQKTDWKAAKNYLKLKATENFISNRSNNGLKRTKIEYLVNLELSKWWFFVGFLATISFLWYEQRFLMNK
ncbi:hypothetical protein WG904_08125 [Pedobacter sp. Du54]|uniref:hypothetical protein n=1 Tax=Pedobacter anseongensis TaxID=3133439 RepID=UPI0030AF8887